MRKSYLLLILIGFAFDLSACTRIFWNKTRTKVSARTMDLNMDDHPTFVLAPRGIERTGETFINPLKWTSKYGTLVLTAFRGNAISEGMNEKGLVAHLLYLQDTKYEKRDGRHGVSNALWAQYILDQYVTVKEVLSDLHTYQVVSTVTEGRRWPLHLCLEDATGDSAILEFIRGKLVVHHGPEYRVMTNGPSYDAQLENLKSYRYFGGDLPLPGDVDSMSRFVRASSFLSTLPQPKTAEETIGYLIGAIRAEQVPFGAKKTLEAVVTDSWPTRWISICDITHKHYYVNLTSLPNVVWVSLQGVDFSPTQKIKKVVLEDPQLSGNITNKFL